MRAKELYAKHGVKNYDELVMLRKYLMRGEITFKDVAGRVASLMRTGTDRQEAEHRIGNKLFIPNTPTLMGAGGATNMMACFCLYVDDSIDGIMEAAKTAAAIFKSGGGLGLEFSALRPRNGALNYTLQRHCKASGPVPFLQIFDATGKAVMAAGMRRAAQLAALNVNHPDIEEFVDCKREDGALSGFNMSVTIDEGPDSVDPVLWDKIVQRAWDNGEPGVVFLDNINKVNPLLDTHGPIKGVNACGEQPLYDKGACTLGHVVLPHVIDKLGDWDELKETVRFGVRFLNRVIDMNHYPTPGIASVVRNVRQIGLGVMGLYDLTQKFNIPFVSQDTLALSEQLGEIIYTTAVDESRKLTELYGTVGNLDRANGMLTTVAPTGHTSRLAGVSYSIYPPLGLAHLMTAEQHLDLVAAWQPWIDSSISYTFNFGEHATTSDIDWLYRAAHERGIKCMSVYRDGSREGQPQEA